MSAGCVVVASDIKNHRELIDNQKTGILFDLENSNLNNILDDLSK